MFTGHDLEVSRALTALALFDLLRFPLFMLPGIINTMVEAGVSLSRVRSFLLCDNHMKKDTGGTLHEIGIRMVNSSYAYESRKPKSSGSDLDSRARELAEKTWEMSLLKSQLEEAEAKIRELTSSTLPTDKDGIRTEIGLVSEDQAPNSLLCLKRINLEVKPGELVAVVGGVGSGKSSLLNSILGEVRELSGTTEVCGKLAFFSQNPFVLNATLKANVLFSHVDEPVDEERYQRVLDCCALGHDLGTCCFDLI